MKLKLTFAILCLSILFSCSEKEGRKEIIVMADPALEEFANMAIERYMAEKESINVKLIAVSSEVIFQRMKAGEKADVVLAFNAEERTGIQWHKMNVLSRDRLVLVQCKNREKAADFKSDSCWVRGWTESPLRKATEVWLNGTKQLRADPSMAGQGLELTPAFTVADSCMVVANSYAQLKDYLDKGWVAGGFCFESMALNNPLQLEIIDRAPPIKEAWTARIPTDRPHPETADVFLDFVTSMPIKVWLASKGFAVDK